MQFAGNNRLPIFFIMNRKLLMHELNRKTVDEFRRSAKTPLVLVLDNVRSQNNIGSIFRTADAFLAEGLYLCGITPVPPHREIQKTALGATESVHWEYHDSCLQLLQALKLRGYCTVVFEQTEKSIPLPAFQPDPATKYALVLGNEVHGVQQEVVDACDHCIEIPQYGTKHSLNIAVSAGIAVWEFYRQLYPGG